MPIAIGLYIAVTAPRDAYLGMDANLVQEGLAYRFTPFNAYGNKMSIDVDKMYDNMMNKFKYGNVSDPKVYIDETVGHMCLTDAGYSGLKAC